MKSFVLLLAGLTALVPSLSATTITATRLLDSTGNTMTSGSLCYAPAASNCTTAGYFAVVTNGKIPVGSIFTATAPSGLFLYDSTSTLILQTPATLTLGATFSVDTFVVPNGMTINVVGQPRIACAPGAIAIQSGVTSPWTCKASVAGARWMNGTSTVSPTGGSGGSGGGSVAVTPPVTSGTPLTVQVGGVPVAVSTLLNFKVASGSGLTITPDSAGGITFNVPAIDLSSFAPKANPTFIGGITVITPNTSYVNLKPTVAAAVGNTAANTAIVPNYVNEYLDPATSLPSGLGWKEFRAPCNGYLGLATTGSVVSEFCAGAVSSAPSQIAAANRFPVSLTTSLASDDTSGDRHFFDRLAGADFDTFSSPLPTFVQGGIQGTGGNAIAIRNFTSAAPSAMFCNKSYLSSTGIIDFVGYSADGTYAGSSYGVGLYSGALQFFFGPNPAVIAIPASSLPTNTYYDLCLTVLNGGTNGVATASVTPSGGTLGALTAISASVGWPAISNVKVQTIAATDTISNLRYAAGSAPQIPIPNFDNASNGVRIINLSAASNPAGSGVNIDILLPASYRPSVTSPWILWAHGDKGTASEMFNPLNNPMVTAFLNAGYVVAASDYSKTDCFGSPNCVLDIGTAVNFVTARFNVAAQPYCEVGSMGGIVMFNAILHGTGNCRAINAAFPVYSLANVYNGGSGPLFADIQDGFGFTSPAGYAAATAGYDPSASNYTAQLAQTPIHIMCSPSDTTVPCAANGQAMATAINAVPGGHAEFVACSGPHGDPSCLRPDLALDFFAKYR